MMLKRECQSNLTRFLAPAHYSEASGGEGEILKIAAQNPL
jgi:hypothetical protein